MTLTEKQRRLIVEILKRNWIYGVNSKVFYDQHLYRYSARMKELRERGYIFGKVREKLGEYNFDRFWMQYDPYTKQTNGYVPKRAKILAETKKRNKSASKPKFEYVFNNITGKYDAYEAVAV